MCIYHRQEAGERGVQFSTPPPGWRAFLRVFTIGRKQVNETGGAAVNMEREQGGWSRGWVGLMLYMYKYAYIYTYTQFASRYVLV